MTIQFSPRLEDGDASRCTPDPSQGSPPRRAFRLTLQSDIARVNDRLHYAPFEKKALMFHYLNVSPLQDHRGGRIFLVDSVSMGVPKVRKKPSTPPADIYDVPYFRK